MRRVSSRQRLVSWDSFDAVQRELDSSNSGDDDEESSFEDATLGPTLSWNTADDGSAPTPRRLAATAGPVAENPAGGGDESSGSQPPAMSTFVVEPTETGFLTGVQPLFKRKRAQRRRKSSPKARAATMLLLPALKDDAEAAEYGTAIAALSSENDDEEARPCLGSQTDDVVVLLSSYLDLRGVQSLAQTNHRFRELLHGEEYVWNVQAQRLWTNLPMASQEIVWDTTSSGGGEERPSPLSKLEVLALAQHPVPTEVDSSIFTPCRWSRRMITLRNRAVAVRSSLQKELVVVPTEDPNRPAVQFVGTPGHGDRSVRANAPLPRPTQLAPRQRGCWRNAFFRRGAEFSPGGSPDTDSPIASSSAHLRSKWQPFVIPTLAQGPGGGLVWDLSPRLVSYFEVEILPSAKSAAPLASLGTTDRPGGSRRPAPSMQGRVRFRLDEDDSDDDEPAVPMSWVRHSKECVAVGLATEEFSMHTRMPGWDSHSWYVRFPATAKSVPSFFA
jgi:hypothetical protein